MMLQTREIITAVGTLACAVGIGFIMQSGDTAELRYKDSAQAPAEIAPSVVDVSASSAVDTVLDVQDITLTSAQADSLDAIVTPKTDVHVASAPASTLIPPKPEVVLPELSCDISVSATASKGAMIDIQLAAPCMPNEHVTVHHNGIMFTQVTARDGSLKISMPALSQDAVVIFAFPNGEGAVDGAKGFLTRLGNASTIAPLMAEVYTFPTAMSGQTGTIDLSVETEVTLMNCGLEIEAQSLELKDGKIKTQDLTLSVPECDAKGSFLVLNNLVQDLKVASN